MEGDTVEIKTVIKEEKIDLSYEEGSSHDKSLNSGKTVFENLSDARTFALKEEDEDSDEESVASENQEVDRFSDKSETTDSESEDEDDEWELPDEAVIAAGNSGLLQGNNSQLVEGAGLSVGYTGSVQGSTVLSKENTELSQGSAGLSPGSAGSTEKGGRLSLESSGLIPGNNNLEKTKSHFKSMGLLGGNVGLFLGKNGLYLARTDIPPNKGLPPTTYANTGFSEERNPELNEGSQKLHSTNAEMPIDLTGLSQSHSMMVDNCKSANNIPSVSKGSDIDEQHDSDNEKRESPVVKRKRNNTTRGTNSGEIKPKRKYTKRKPKEVKVKVKEGGKQTEKNPVEEGEMKPKKKYKRSEKKRRAAEERKKNRKFKIGPMNATSFPCTECDKVYDRYMSLHSHIARCHKTDRSFLCSVCGEGFHMKYMLDSHMIKHDPEEIHTCEVCNKQYTHWVYLKRHMWKHKRAPKSFECDICHKTVTTKISLEKHMDTHNAVRTLKKTCTVCGKDVLDLNVHMRTHSGEKPFACELCGKKFGTHSQRAVHRKIHSDTYDYPCPQCDQKFKAKTTLNRHLRIHTGEKPYECEQCGMRFRQKSVLTTHYKVHTGERRKKKMIAEMQCPEDDSN